MNIFFFFIKRKLASSSQEIPALTPIVPKRFLRVEHHFFVFEYIFFWMGEERVRFWCKRKAVLSRGFLPRFRAAYFKMYVGEVSRLCLSTPNNSPFKRSCLYLSGLGTIFSLLFKSLLCSYFLWNRPPLSLGVFMGNNIFVQLKASPVLLS